MHDGYLNTYSFSKDGKKIILAPLSPSQLPTKSSPKFPHQLNLFLDFDSPPLKVLPTPETFKNFAQKPPPSPRIPTPSHGPFKHNQPHRPLLNLRSNSSSQGENDGGPSKGTSYGPRESIGQARIRNFAAQGTHGQVLGTVHCDTVVRTRQKRAQIKPLFLPGFEARFC